MKIKYLGKRKERRKQITQIQLYAYQSPWNKYNIWQTKFFPCPFCNNMNQMCMHTKNKESHSSNNTHIERFQTRTKRLCSKVYQEKWKKAQKHSPKLINVIFFYFKKMTRVFLSSQTSNLIFLLCECTTKKSSFTFSWKTKQKHIILALFF